VRILHLIKHCEGSNGHVNVAVDLACVHARHGHVVMVASGGGLLAPFLEQNGIAHAKLIHGRNPLGVGLALAKLVRLCRAFRPDVIHAHMMSSAVLGFLVSRLCGVPLVTTVHNSFDRHSHLMRLGDAVVAVSEAERRLLLSRGYPDRKLVTIHNGPVGSPREALSTAEPLSAVHQPSIITVSGLHARKGCHHVIEAFAAVATRFPAWHLNIVGEGPDRLKLEERVRELGLAERIHFLGVVFHPELWLTQSQIFVLASLAEPFGLVVVEARAAGCAIVASDVGGIPEVLEFGQSGQLVPPGRSNAIADRLAELIADPDLLSTWRRRASQGVERFSAEITAAKYLTLYQKLAAQNGRQAEDKLSAAGSAV
jgi:glycosyltransferase involved in cell wall biosynthesis